MTPSKTNPYSTTADEGEKILGPNSVSLIFQISSKNTFKSSASSKVDTGMDSFLEGFLIDTVSMLFMRISVLMKNTTTYSSF